MRLAFQVAYRGSNFFGSQVQAGARTVEGEFIAACKRLNLFQDWHEAGFCMAGRTDRGVHALGQVCAFSTDLSDRAIIALNHQLPRDCWCRSYAFVDDDFHPRYQARSRTYRYYIAETGLDRWAMKRAAHLLEGTHDFSSFSRPEGRNPFRTVQSVRVWGDHNLTVVSVCGESFLWHMVRGIVTALLAAGRGTATEDDVSCLLNGNGIARVPAAPAEGLVLWDVDCGISFTPLPLLESHRQELESLHRHYMVLERITRLLCGGDPDSPDETFKPAQFD